MEDDIDFLASNEFNNFLMLLKQEIQKSHRETPIKNNQFSVIKNIDI